MPAIPVFREVELVALSAKLCSSPPERSDRWVMVMVLCSSVYDRSRFKYLVRKGSVMKVVRLGINPRSTSTGDLPKDNPKLELAVIKGLIGDDVYGNNASKFELTL
ncbi:hypothetical protein Tco_1439134 [Tanacetum coccineum]